MEKRTRDQLAQELLDTQSKIAFYEDQLRNLRDQNARHQAQIELQAKAISKVETVAQRYLDIITLLAKGRANDS